MYIQYTQIAYVTYYLRHVHLLCQMLSVMLQQNMNVYTFIDRVQF